MLPAALPIVLVPAEARQTIQAVLEQNPGWKLLGLVQIGGALLPLFDGLADPSTPGKPAQSAQSALSESILVTLDQAAASVGKSKRTLERLRRKMPPPTIPGGGGRAAQWEWDVIRPWLEARFKVGLDADRPFRRRL
jgi:hypothetical protein